MTPDITKEDLKEHGYIELRELTEEEKKRGWKG